MRLKKLFKVLALCVLALLCFAIALHAIRLQTDPAYRQKVENDRAERQKHQEQVRAHKAQVKAERARAKAQAEEAEKVQRDKEKFAKEHDTTWAYTMSKQFIREKLKAPGSADFPWAGTDTIKVVKTGDAKYVVSAYVDAQNSFGAKLRSKWICEVEYAGNKNWRATPNACGLLESSERLPCCS